MNGLTMLFWAAIYEGYNLIRYPSRRWVLDCAFCDETKRARSHNMVLTKRSLHTHFEHDDIDRETLEEFDHPDPECVNTGGGPDGIPDGHLPDTEADS